MARMIPDGYEVRMVGTTVDTGHRVWRAARVGGEFVGPPRKHKRNAVADACVAGWQPEPANGRLIIVIPCLAAVPARHGYPTSLIAPC